VIAPLPVFLVLGCAELFGLDAPDLDGVAGRASIGGGAAAGGDRGGTSGAGRGGSDGGAAGEAGHGGSEGGGGPIGGSGGSATGPAGSAGASVGGKGGSGGESPWAEIGSPCEHPGALACVSEAFNQTALCNGATWVRGKNCDDNSLCDRETGTCEYQCVTPPGHATCNGSDAMVCGPDGVNPQLERCIFGCIQYEPDAGASGCVGLGEGQILFDAPRAISNRESPWPDPLIPVCFSVADEWSPDEVRTIRDAVAAEWGRYTAVGFSGWDQCVDDEARVELNRVEDCDLELARIPRIGFPGPGVALPIDLCLSYLDKQGVSTGTEPILGATALHVFGHVLGFEDERYRLNGTDIMMQGIDLSGISALGVGISRIPSLHATYGAKPSRSLIHRGGRCLSGNAGTLSQGTCDGTAPQGWRLSAGWIEHVGSGQCLRVTNGSTVGLGNCVGAESFLPSRVEWRAQGGYCVSKRTDPPLGVESCTPSRAADQTWRFEFLGDDSVRIGLASDATSCVLRPDDWSNPANAQLGLCDGVRDVFEIRGGRLEVAGHCLQSGTQLGFWPCSETPLQRFVISGPLQNEVEALTLANTSGVELTISLVNGSPSPEQIFDYQL
jgi:hypothetical protein